MINCTSNPSVLFPYFTGFFPVNPGKLPFFRNIFLLFYIFPFLKILVKNTFKEKIYFFKDKICLFMNFNHHFSKISLHKWIIFPFNSIYCKRAKFIRNGLGTKVTMQFLVYSLVHFTTITEAAFSNIITYFRSFLLEMIYLPNIRLRFHFRHKILISSNVCFE